MCGSVCWMFLLLARASAHAVYLRYITRSISYSTAAAMFSGISLFRLRATAKANLCSLHLRYGWLVLGVELLGVTAVLPYGAMLVVHTESTGSPGLPADDGSLMLPPDKRFRVHVMVPCYKVCRDFKHDPCALSPSGASRGAHKQGAHTCFSQMISSAKIFSNLLAFFGGAKV